MSERRAAGAGGVALALRARDGGRRPPVLLVHGLASNARLWDPVAGLLHDEGHPVLAVDLRGHGQSAKPDADYGTATVVADLVSVIIGENWCRPVVVGQSWGANVALELAARHPGVVGAVVCVDGGWIELARRFPDWEDCARELAPPRTEGTPAGELRARLRAQHPGWPEAGIEGFMASFEVRADGTVAPWLDFDRHLQVLRGLWEHSPSAVYADVHVPVLLVPATGGPGPGPGGSGPEAVAEAAAALPDARVAGLDGDHDLHAHHPEELARLVAAWIAEVVPA